MPGEETPFAREGTIAHEFAALYAENIGRQLSTWVDKLDALKRTAKAFYAEHPQMQDATELMIASAEKWQSLARDQHKIGSQCFIEHRVYMEPAVPGCYGTLDLGFISQTSVYVNDFKFGAGVRVYARENPQLKLYAYGLLQEALRRGYNPDEVVITIYQPRVADEPSTWTLDTDDLLEWVEKQVAPKAAEALKGQGDFVPGDHCRFCNAHTSCRAFYEKFEDILAIVDKRTITPEELHAVLAHGSAVKSWIEKVTRETRAKMVGGARVPGFKLVRGRSERAPINEDDIIEELVALGYTNRQIFKMDLHGVTALEALLGKKKFGQYLGDLYRVQEGAPTIAPEDDPREAISTGSDYDDEIDLT